MADYLCSRKIAIDNTKVSGTSNLLDFPVLISLQEEYLKTTGCVTNSDGYDIVFTESDGSTLLDHEIESYDGDAGTLVAWVRIPTLKYNEDTDIFMYFGNSGISASQENVAGVWDANYKGVWHMSEDASGTGTADLYKDSTSNSNHCVDLISASGQSGQINGGQEFNPATSDNTNCGSDVSLNITNKITLSAWVYMDQLPAVNDWYHVVIKESSTIPYCLYIARKGSNETVIGADFVINGKRWDSWDKSNSIDINILPNRWTYLNVTFDGSDFKLFTDSVLDATENVPGTIDDSSSLNLYFGKQASSETVGYFDGQIDEVRISNIDRDEDWIKTCYNNQSSPSTFYQVTSQ